MPYATQQNLVDQFGERELIALTDRDSVGVIDPAVLARALADADALIDSYLVARYSLPLSGVYPVLRMIAGDLARYLLSGAGVAEVEVVRARYKDAIRYLESVRDGKTVLGAEATAHTAAGEGARIVATGSDRVFTADTLADFIG
ncbi:gp436 family protein [Accumulibacter sp.]|uniref:gp436 family protein n=1 Tax=Accumulibacter sp. TaxID=2053492 RepID=UPI0025E4C69D|nr:DUF1320 domain-containing protein [Accumulibacter sp.]MCM8595138.1 DUF1320 domain-containing protein [Accumulibacter sp.]MCM8625524.1 DUF1320 domain-containing protein [Accumulibacter sp.]MDS4049284.1 DUF1320 domain-containing protein [Accumulibacter sp.]